MLSIHRDASKILERVKTTKEEEIDGINQRRIVLPQRDGVTEPSVRLGHRHSKKDIGPILFFQTQPLD
jgi:hypothetical protein